MERSGEYFNKHLTASQIYGAFADDLETITTLSHERGDR